MRDTKFTLVTQTIPHRESRRRIMSGHDFRTINLLY